MGKERKGAKHTKSGGKTGIMSRMQQKSYKQVESEVVTSSLSNS